MPITVERYTADLHEVWDAFVLNAAKPSFLLQRGYMGYHADRFTDCSLVLRKPNGKVCGLLPANISDEGRTVESHGGLTYGGLITAMSTHSEDVMQMLDVAAQYYRLTLGASMLRYRAIPHIYATYPAEADLYWLFRHSASLTARTLSTAIDLHCPIPYSTLRRRQMRKAEEAGLQLNDEGNFDAFWPLLENVLQERHGVRPVHTLQEMQLLKSRFSANIRLFTAEQGNTMLSGAVVYETPVTAHAQYIAASDEARECGALDLLFDHIISHYSTATQHPRYFDFGISTERGGLTLNNGLLSQKEGFGGRAVCYDTYECPLS